MNCQKGDLAIITKSDYGNCGAGVTCLEYVGKKEGIATLDYWLVESNFPLTAGFDTGDETLKSRSVLIPDHCLLPLRPEPDPESILASMPMLLTEV